MTRPTHPARSRRRPVHARLPGEIAPAVEGLELRVFLSSPGDLDSSFGTGGRFVPDPDSPAGHTVPTDLVVQGDGKLLYLGIGYNDVAPVVRLNADGSVDTTFGQNGLALSGYGPYLSDGVALAVGPQGKIAAAGFAAPYRDELPLQATLVVYNANGTLDTNFDGDGILSAPQFPRGFSDVAIQSDGKIVVVGPDKLVRYDANGTPDATFGGGDGIADYSGKRVLIDAGGKLVVLGYSAIYRFTTDGTLDPTFDADGVIPNVHGTDLALARDGDVLLVGNGAHAEYLTRFNPNGSLDTTFGNATPGNTYVPGGQRLAVGTNDIFVGDTFASTAVPYDDFEIRAYTPAGKVDTAFGNAGRVQTDMNDASKDALVALAVQPDGKLVALGQTEAQPAAFPSRVPVSGLARYLTPAPQPPTGQSPFNGTPLDLPGTLQFENYDYGGEGIAYHDLDAANVGGVYRTDGADVQSIPSGGYNLGFARAGEWTVYTVNIPQSGDYDFEVRLASLKGGGHFSLQVDGLNVADGTAPNTRDWQKYDVVELGNTHVSAGVHVLRLMMDVNDPTGYVANFDSLRVTPHAAPAPQTPFDGKAFTTPGVLQLENFDEGGEGIAYHDTDAVNQGGAYRTNTGVDVEAIPASAGGGNALAFAKAGEWTEYTFVVPDLQGASYDPMLRYAAPRGGEVELSIDGVPFGSPITLHNTRSWQDYQYAFPTFDLHITPGTHVLRLTQLRNGDYGYVANFDSLEFLRYREPYYSTPFNPGETIQAEDFDTGGEGWTYHDTDRANLGDSNHRPDDGVDIQTAADAADAFPGLNVGFTRAGEWIEYAVYGPDNDGDLLALQARVASLKGGGKFHFEVDGKTIASFTAPATGSWQSYTTLTTPKNIRLTPDHHTLRLVMDQNDSTGYVANFNWLRLTP